MTIIYLGCFVEDSQYKSFIDSNTVITTSTTTFQKALLNGFGPIPNTDLLIVNAPDIGSFPLRSKKLFIPSGKFKINGILGINCSYINLTFFKGWFIYKSVFSALNMICKNKRNDIVVIVVYSVIYPYIKAAIDIKRKYNNVKVCPIVLDLPEYFGDKSPLLSRFLPNNTRKIQNYYHEFDGGILLTKQMKERLFLSDKPTILIEGIYNSRNKSEFTGKQKKTIMYSGKLDSRFGLDVLIQAFVKIPDKEFKLWIYGDGTARRMVKSFAENDKRITYFGYRSQDEIFNAQRQASILVNPRQNIGEYTKYSFPSKTMEYLASGTPVVMYKLDGIPDEYDKYLIYPKDNSIEELTKVLYEIGCKSEDYLNHIGEKGKKFILNNKSSEVQADRLIKFLMQNYG